MDQGAKGILVQAVGMGNMNASMFEAVKYALSKGVPVVISTRVHNGRTYPLYGFQGGGKTIFDAGAVMAGDLSSQTARLLLMLMLHQGEAGKAELQAACEVSDERSIASSVGAFIGALYSRLGFRICTVVDIRRLKLKFCAW